MSQKSLENIQDIGKSFQNKDVKKCHEFLQENTKDELVSCIYNMPQVEGQILSGYVRGRAKAVETLSAGNDTGALYSILLCATLEQKDE